MAAGRTDKQFSEAMKELLDERDMSLRALSRELQRKYNWGSVPFISFLARGEMVPNVSAIEQIASALQVSPDHFPEYRLAQARFAFDPEEVGLKAALRNLRFLESAVDGGSEAHAPRDLLRRARRGARAGRASSAGS